MSDLISIYHMDPDNLYVNSIHLHVYILLFKNKSSLCNFYQISLFDCYPPLQSHVNQDDFETALRETFVVKDDDNIAALVAAAVEELKAEEMDMLEYQQLFTEVNMVIQKQPCLHC